VVIGRVLEDASTAGLLAGLDISMQPADLATLDRYLATLRDLQRGGLRISIHLGELFGAGFSRRVLSRLIPSRIGHGVLREDRPAGISTHRRKRAGCHGPDLAGSPTIACACSWSDSVSSEITQSCGTKASGQ
jgi:hypothetical protein